MSLGLVINYTLINYWFMISYFDIVLVRIEIICNFEDSIEKLVFNPLYFREFSLLNYHQVQKISGTRMAMSLVLATFSDWLTVDHLQISDEHVSSWIADWGLPVSSWPPNTNRFPLITRLECAASLFGNGGPIVSKKREKINAFTCYTHSYRE